MGVEQGSQLPQADNIDAGHREVSVPDEYREALASGEIAEIVRVGVITARGNPEPLQPMHCTNKNHNPMVYGPGAYSRLSNGRLLIVSEIWAFRCTTSGCPTSMIVLPEVRDEVRQQILAAAPQEV